MSEIDWGAVWAFVWPILKQALIAALVAILGLLGYDKYVPSRYERHEGRPKSQQSSGTDFPVCARRLESLQHGSGKEDDE